MTSCPATSDQRPADDESPLEYNAQPLIVAGHERITFERLRSMARLGISVPVTSNSRSKPRSELLAASWCTSAAIICVDAPAVNRLPDTGISKKLVSAAVLEDASVAYVIVPCGILSRNASRPSM